MLHTHFVTTDFYLRGVHQWKLLHSLTVINNAINPSEEESESVFESVEVSDLKPSSADDNRLVQPAK